MEAAVTLRRVGLCWAIVLAAFALLPGGASAQQKSLREQLVGVWIPTAHETTFQDGSKRQQFGAKPNGMMILDASGNYTQVLTHPELPKFRSADRTQATPEEHAATIKGSVAHFGTWTVDEAGKTLTFAHMRGPGSFTWEQARRIRYDVVGSTFPNQVGTDLKTTVSLAGDEWTSTIPRTTSGRQSVMVWKRTK
jgi:hypothetical protein